GTVCEVADTSDLYRAPAHPYTMLLISSAPTLGGTFADTLGGPPVEATSSELPSPLDPPSGCRFRTRCPLATEICATERPEMREIAPGHHAACHHPLQPAASGGPGHRTAHRAAARPAAHRGTPHHATNAGRHCRSRRCYVDFCSDRLRLPGRGPREAERGRKGLGAGLVGGQVDLRAALPRQVGP